MYSYILIEISIVFSKPKSKNGLLQITSLPSAFKSPFWVIWNIDNIDTLNTTYSIYSSHCFCIHPRHITFILVQIFSSTWQTGSWLWILLWFCLKFCFCFAFAWNSSIAPTTKFCSSPLDSKKSILLSFRKAESLSSCSGFRW